MTYFILRGRCGIRIKPSKKFRLGVRVLNNTILNVEFAMGWYSDIPVLVYLAISINERLITSLLFIKARLLNPASRNVHKIPLSWESLYNHVENRYETYQPVNIPSSLI
jgi:hypothetical protein